MICTFTIESDPHGHALRVNGELFQTYAVLEDAEAAANRMVRQAGAEELHFELDLKTSLSDVEVRVAVCQMAEAEKV